MKRAKIDDITREAGVSRATVDRVIHGRVNVRSETAQKVAAAARRLGFYATGLIDRSLEKPLPKSKILALKASICAANSLILCR